MTILSRAAAATMALALVAGPALADTTAAPAKKPVTHKVTHVSHKAAKKAKAAAPAPAAR